MIKDYYKILQVETNATSEEIKNSYKKLVKKYHPDINKAENAELTFKEINEAFNTLSNEIERLKYDTLMGIDPIPKKNKEKQTDKQKNTQEEKSKTSSNIHKNNKKNTFNDFVNKFFEEKEKEIKIKPIKGENIRASVEITPKEAADGVIKKINIMHKEKCPKCKGRKFANGSICSSCKGTGEISIHKKITITVPKNPKPNSILTIKHEGMSGKYGGESGDLILKIKIIPKDIFGFQNGRATIEVPLTPWEAFFGGDILIPTMNGNATIKIPPQTNSHDKFRITNGGILDKKTGIRGDLIVEIKIQTPQKPTIEEIRAYKQIKEADKANVREELFR